MDLSRGSGLFAGAISLLPCRVVLVMTDAPEEREDRDQPPAGWVARPGNDRFDLHPARAQGCMARRPFDRFGRAHLHCPRPHFALVSPARILVVGPGHDVRGWPDDDRREVISSIG
jgi:hypothetical protein